MILLVKNDLMANITHHTGLSGFGGINYDENKTFDIVINCINQDAIEENKVITFLDKKTFNKIKPLMFNSNLTRKEKIEILRENSPTPLCETDRIAVSKNIKCNLLFKKEGKLIIFPTTDHVGCFNVVIPQYYWSKKYDDNRQLFMIILMSFLLCVNIYNLCSGNDNDQDSSEYDKEYDSIPDIL